MRGLDRRAEEELRERVIDFSELADAIDAPVQSYSTGMKARLAYALSAQLQPDVLLVDEVLAVGDIAFQRKCSAHMLSYLDRGGSLLLVSHNPWHIQSVCGRGILIDRGRVTFAGTAADTLNAMFEQRAVAGDLPPAPAAGGPVAIETLRAEPADVQSGEALRITVAYRAAEPVEVLWGFSIWTMDQWVCVAGEHDMTARAIEPGAGELTCVIPRLPLVGGRYHLRASIVDARTRLPFALAGWEGGGTVFEVRAKGTITAVAKMAMHQLVTVDVDWS
jgi:energy-coupling factor transporter ATP-binding protein EcfA2